ncbi:hypothetical protein BJV82DRAFT_595102 [Fennellomyces sp. T-0311]|nr:hypothetical protein BJV82DRAFT_595102 [Fennellomyces sp. T-0311]
MQEVSGQDKQSLPLPPGFPPIRYATFDQVTEETLIEAEEALKNPFIFDKPIKKVAVIGAGSSGLTAAKALKDHGMEVNVFERDSDVGGLWSYSDKKPKKPPITSKNPLGFIMKEIPQTLADHAPPTACYRDLYNNTPTPMMQYEDFPWPENTPWNIPQDRVHRYLKDYTEHYCLRNLISFDTSVDRVEKVQDHWHLTMRKADKRPDGTIEYSFARDTFDAVVVASGAFRQPVLPDFPYLHDYDKRWPHKVSHSKQFRKYEEFAGKNVLLVGAGVSAVDIARLLNGEAKNVYLSMRGDFESFSAVVNLVRSTLPSSVNRKPNIKQFADIDGLVNGTITFEDDTTIVDIDHVIFCTGYTCNFPFFDSKKFAHITSFDDSKSRSDRLILTDGRRVLDTYRDIFFIYDPTLAFIGFPSHITSFGMFYYYAQAVSRVWSGAALLPSQQIMLDFQKTSVHPYPFFDLTFAGDRLHIQRLVAWLNYHAEKLKQDSYVLKGPDPALDNMWHQVEEAWLNSDELIAAIKKKNAQSN